MRPWALVFLLALAGCGHLIPANNQTLDPARLEGGAYRLDPDHTALLWKVNHLGFTKYVGRFDRVEGSLDFDPEAPAAARLEVIVATASVGSVDPKLDSDLRGSSWFDAATWPQIVFRSTAIDVTVALRDEELLVDGPPPGIERPREIRIARDEVVHGVRDVERVELARVHGHAARLRGRAHRRRERRNRGSEHGASGPEHAAPGP